ncbi:MAG: roadblock/LC7 domain-containing protein [Xenococcaceae cyanobacterium MO_207.B15]|nr:roadblock/LC7 domain-containing protein [Xenococcaceae cyanobacterium MO_207.B15]
MIETESIKELIEDFVDNTSNINAAILASHDGLCLASAFSYTLNKDKAAAITISVLSVVEKFQKNLNLGTIDNIFIEGEEGYCFVVDCHNNLNLLVLANKNIIKGWFFIEIENLVNTIKLILKAKSFHKTSFLPSELIVDLNNQIE